MKTHSSNYIHQATRRLAANYALKIDKKLIRLRGSNTKSKMIYCSRGFSSQVISYNSNDS